MAPYLFGLLANSHQNINLFPHLELKTQTKKLNNQEHDLLTVEFKQVVLNQETIFGGWRIYHNGCDFSFFKLKTKMTGGILVESQSSFEGSESKID